MKSIQKFIIIVKEVVAKEKNAELVFPVNLRPWELVFKN
jgi:hypothetical protein